MDRALVARIVVLVLLCGCPLYLGGCKCNVSVNRQSNTQMGSHAVVVKPGSTYTSHSSLTSGDKARHTFTCGNVTVRIIDERLIVNDMSYGLLKAGDSVLIDNGKVFVEGKAVEAQVLSDEERSELNIDS